MKFLFLSLLFISQAFAHEKEERTRADKLAHAKFYKKRQHQWPFPLLSIGHAMQSYQDYSASPYWHDGLDIRSHEDQPIYAAAGGKIVNIENYVRGNPLYWEVAILDAEGFVWKYHHVAKETIQLKLGDSIEAGALIGNVVKWPISSFGEVYHHLHLLIIAADGKYINPFLMMEPLADNKPPVIKKIGIAQNHKPIDGNRVKGAHALYVEASDLVLHEKFLLPPHKISYRLDQGEEKLVWEFIHLPSGTNDLDYIKDFYFKGTCGNYQCRQFFFNLNFSPSAPRSLMNLSPGTHVVEVAIEDVAGNRAIQSYRWEVLN
jgi:hypothetical protein